ncbi:MAG: T9SS type A sorting domain-containing protein, partial [Ferruginibacter sp.]
EIGKNVTVCIFAADGKKLIQQIFGKVNQTETIHLAKLAAGAYNVNIQTASKTQNTKIIVSK